jgi:hypothetical protein
MSFSMMCAVFLTAARRPGMFQEMILSVLTSGGMGRRGMSSRLKYSRSLVLVAAYVPNSGQTLDRLDYRVDGWDIYIREYLANLRDSNDNSNHKYKGVVYCGDMNVGHLDVDIYNHTAKHIVKQAGLTPRERASFTKLLEGGWRDSFRYLHPCKYVALSALLCASTAYCRCWHSGSRALHVLEPANVCSWCQLWPATGLLHLQ